MSSKSFELFSTDANLDRALVYRSVPKKVHFARYPQRYHPNEGNRDVENAIADTCTVEKVAWESRCPYD